MAHLTVGQDALDHEALNKHLTQACWLLDTIDAAKEKLEDHKDELRRIFRRRYKQDGKIIHELAMGVAKYIDQDVYDYPVEKCLPLVPAKMHDDLFPRAANKAAIRKLMDADAPVGLALKKVAKKDTQAILVIETTHQKFQKAAKAKAKRAANKKKGA